MRHLWRIFLLLFVHLSVQGQIVDDTTQLIYGPETSSYIYEKDILYGNERYYYVDTTLYDLHMYDELRTRKMVYQNLGTFGTPLTPVFFNLPDEIGRRYGFNAFTPYAIQPEEIRYFDTKSPFTDLRYIQGTQGLQFLSGLFSRNINPRLNFGLKVNRFRSEKIIGRQQDQNEGEHWSFAAWTRYFSWSRNYQLLFNLTYMDHGLSESGGIRPGAGDERGDMFDYLLEDSWLDFANSNDKRFGLHLYQELAVVPDLDMKLYHISDYKDRHNRYRDSLYTTDSLYYSDLNTNYNWHSTHNHSHHRLFENQFGFKGEFGNLFYRAFYRRKDFDYEQKYNPQFYYMTDQFLGAEFRYQIQDTITASLLAEKRLGQDYRIEAKAETGFLSAGAKLLNFSPSLFQMYYDGNHLKWNLSEELENSVAQQFYIQGEYDNDFLEVEPKVSYTNVNNHIYLDSLGPVQLQDPVNITELSLYTHLNAGIFHFENYLRYNITGSPGGADSVLNIPDIYDHARLYVQSMIFNDALLFQFGTDIYYRPAYYGKKWQPLTQHYYYNDSEFLLEEYLLADIFLNVQIDEARIFVKVSHVNQGLFRDGFFATPYYPYQQRMLVLGLSWRFYN